MPSAERHDRDGCEYRLFPQRPDGEPRVLRQILEPRQSALVAQGVHRPRRSAGADHRVPAGQVNRNATAACIFGRQVQMELQLFLQFSIVARAKKRAPQARQGFTDGAPQPGDDGRLVVSIGHSTGS